MKDPVKVYKAYYDKKTKMFYKKTPDGKIVKTEKDFQDLSGMKRDEPVSLKFILMTQFVKTQRKRLEKAAYDAVKNDVENFDENDAKIAFDDVLNEWEAKSRALSLWLFWSGLFSIFSLGYLLFFALVGETPPSPTQSFLKNLSFSILILTGIGILYSFKPHPYFFGLIPLALIPSFPYLRIKKIYTVRWGQPSNANCWICRTCGRENSNILIECPDCHSRQKPA